MRSDPARSPLGQALPETSIGGVPLSVWLAIANGLSDDGSRYNAIDAEKFARKHPKIVQRWGTGADARYERPDSLKRAYIVGDLSSSWPARQGHEDDIALELVALWNKPSEGPEVARYLESHLPDHCADGAGRGIEALRVRSGEPGVDSLLAQALALRVRHVPTSERTGLLREAISIFTAVDDLVAVARTRDALSDHLEESGNREAAIGELELLVAEYVRLAAKDSYHDPSLGEALYILGRVYGLLGRRRDAREATKTAISQFTLLVSQDQPYEADLLLARWQLSRLRWYRP